jgi:sulfide:quinone oxidoreductase
VPGFAAAHNLYDARAVPALAAALDAFAGGRILLAISSMPFKCPAAPYEAAMVIASLLERRGVRDGTEIELTTPEPRPLPVAPASCSADLLLHVKSKGIAFAPDHRPKAVHADRREVEYENGARKTYDLLIGVPVHRAPAVVREAGLTDASGWVPVDPRTLETPHRGVFAVGDVNTIKLPVGKPLPKAGVFAEAQAKVVAANIAADLLGRAAADAFDGRGSCFVELGDGIATAVQGEFYASPEPVVRLAMPTREALAEKERFETDRLRAWFGG